MKNITLFVCLFLFFGISPVLGRSIEGILWKDSNSNGIREIAEIKIPNVKIKLFRNDTIVAQTTTNAQGKYVFDTDILEGETYILKILATDFPSGLVPSPTSVGEDRTIDSDGVFFNQASGLKLTFNPDQTLIEYDFGFIDCLKPVFKAKAVAATCQSKGNIELELQSEATSYNLFPLSEIAYFYDGASIDLPASNPKIIYTDLDTTEPYVLRIYSSITNCFADTVLNVNLNLQEGTTSIDYSKFKCDSTTQTFSFVIDRFGDLAILDMEGRAISDSVISGLPQNIEYRFVVASACKKDTFTVFTNCQKYYIKTTDSTAIDKDTVIVAVLENITISDSVYLDQNNNGMYDTNEPFEIGIEVVLLNDKNQEVARTKTNENGVYSFVDMPNMKYYVEVIRIVDPIPQEIKTLTNNPCTPICLPIKVTRIK